MHVASGDGQELKEGVGNRGFPLGTVAIRGRVGSGLKFQEKVFPPSGEGQDMQSPKEGDLQM